MPLTGQVPAEGADTPQAPGRTPHNANQRTSGTTQPQAPLRCPGAEDTSPEASALLSCAPPARRPARGTGN